MDNKTKYLYSFCINLTKGKKMKTKYLVKLNGKTISTRVVKKKVVCLQILHCETTGVFKSIDTYYNVQHPRWLVEKNDNPNTIFYDWNVFKKIGNDYVVEFNYSPTQQKIDIKKQSRNLEYQEFQKQFNKECA
jgi:hypothetical protein